MQTRSKRTYEIRHGYLTFRGPTKREAEHSRDLHMVRLFSNEQDFVPEVITASDRVRGVVWMTGHGSYCYKIQRQDPKDRGHLGASRWVDGMVCYVDVGSRSDAVIRCRRHLAQEVFEFMHDQSAEVSATGIAVIDVNDVEGRAEHQNWIYHQVAYRLLCLRHRDVSPADISYQSGPGGKFYGEMASIQAAVRSGQQAAGVL